MSFSALQRAEIAEIATKNLSEEQKFRFSALQRAEIAEIYIDYFCGFIHLCVSVLFNEPKLLKSVNCLVAVVNQRVFQCSSTSRNC